MGGADRHGIYRLGRRKERAIPLVRVEGLEHRTLSRLRCRGFKLYRIGEPGHREPIHDVSGRNDKNNSIPMREVVDEPAQRTHDSRKRPLLVCERKVDDHNFRSCGRLAAFALFDASHGPVDVIYQQSVRRGAFKPVLGRHHDGPHIETPAQRRFLAIQVAVKDERGHFGAVLPSLHWIRALQIVGVVDDETPGQADMVLHRKPVQQCCDRLLILIGCRPGELWSL